MKYLYPSCGDLPQGFIGYLTSPRTGIASGIKEGKIWACDNNAFTGFSHTKFISFVDGLKSYKEKCLFVVVPDVLFDAPRTIARFYEYCDVLNGFPLAFVAQDGQEDLDFPDNFDTLFIGGSTRWKMSLAAVECINRGIDLGKHIHIGRVNSRKRYLYFRSMNCSGGFTCDGTRIRFEKDKAIRDWRKYQDESYQLNFFISSNNNRS